MTKHRTGHVDEKHGVLILASASPRRKELLRQLKIPFKVIPSRMHEPPPGMLGPVIYAKKLALAKAQIVAKQVREGLILGADTVVVHKGDVLGKPADFSDACRMLSRLSGTTHQVITGVALLNAATGKSKIGYAASQVTMRRLNPEEIGRYAKKHIDKAGAYAAQEKKDPVVLKVKGSYTNVVGLPLEVVKQLLKSPP